MVQLQHARSGKFLVCRPGMAVQEREALLLELDAKGSEAAWFKLFPRYKTRDEGGKIYFRSGGEERGQREGQGRPQMTTPV